jgi:hypothetical protein
MQSQVLFYQAEEQFDLPATLAYQGHGQRIERKLVGEEHQTLPGLGIDVAEAP